MMELLVAVIFSVPVLIYSHGPGGSHQREGVLDELASLRPSEPFLSSNWKGLCGGICVKSLLPAEAPGWLVLPSIARDHPKVPSGSGDTLGEAPSGLLQA